MSDVLRKTILMNILHFTSILPAPLTHKKRENDILYRLAKRMEQEHPGDRHVFLYLVPYSNLLLSLFKSRWKEYYHLIRKGSFDLKGMKVYVIGLPGFSRDIKLRPLFARLSFLLFRKSICRILQEVKPDIIHAHSMRGAMELAELLRRKFGVAFFVSGRQIHPNALQRIRTGRVQPCKILAMNELAKNRIHGATGKEVFMIPHPVDDDFFIIRNNAGKREGQVSLISVCRLLPLKNLRAVITAIVEGRLEANYTIVGDGPDRENLEALIKKHQLEERVKLSGHLPHHRVKEILGSFDLFVMPSYPETLGRVYFEAMAAGLPVVAARGTGVDGLIEHEKHGYLVDHQNPTELMSVLKTFILKPPNERLQMKQHALLLAKQFTWNSILQKHQRFYHE